MALRACLAALPVPAVPVLPSRVCSLCLARFALICGGEGCPPQRRGSHSAAGGAFGRGGAPWPGPGRRKQGAERRRTNPLKPLKIQNQIEIRKPPLYHPIKNSTLNACHTGLSNSVLKRNRARIGAMAPVEKKFIV